MSYVSYRTGSLLLYLFVIPELSPPRHPSPLVWSPGLTECPQGLHGLLVAADPEVHEVSLHNPPDVLTARVPEDILHVVSLV